MEFNEKGMDKKDLFDDQLPTLVKASHGKRFINYIVDVIVFNIFLFIVFTIAVNIHPDFMGWVEAKTKTGFTFVEQMLVMVSYGTWMFMIEAVMKGKSFGKLVTGTRAVRNDGALITVRDAQIRGLCRMVPFYALSGLGIPCYPWHDRWSKTVVIDEKVSTIDYRK